MVADDETYRRAVEAYKDPNNEYSLLEIATKFKVAKSTLQRRVHGQRTVSEFKKTCQILTETQEEVLETYVIYLRENAVYPTRNTIRQLAGCILGSPEKAPGYSWFNGFVDRSKYLSFSESGKIDFPRIRENGEILIKNFFKLYRYYIEKFNVTFDNVWSLDEAGFQINETPPKKGSDVGSHKPPNTKSGQSTESVSVLELVSATGKISFPLFICKGKHLMQKWLPGKSEQSFSLSATEQSNIITSDVFFEWFDHCPELQRDPNGEYKILLIDGHSSHRDSKLIELAMERRIILLYYPSHLTHIRQPLDLTTFGEAKEIFKKEMAHAFMEGYTPSKELFFKTYFEIRDSAYSKNIISEGFREAGLYPVNENIAIENHVKITNTESTESSTASGSKSGSQKEKEKEKKKEEDDPDSIEHLNWRSVNRSLMNFKIDKVTIKKFKGIFLESEKLRAENALLKQENLRLLAIQREAEGNMNRKRPKLSNEPNRVVYQSLAEIHDLSECPI